MSEPFRPIVRQQLELMDGDVIVSIYHVNVAYIYYGPVSAVPYPVNNYYRVIKIEPDGQLKDGTMRFHMSCEKIDMIKQEVIEEVEVHEDTVQIITFI